MFNFVADLWTICENMCVILPLQNYLSSDWENGKFVELLCASDIGGTAK